MPGSVDSPKQEDRLASEQPIDIGGSKIPFDTKKKLQELFVEPKKRGDRPTLPEELLYSDVGLSVWNRLIQSPRYYQFRDEIALFKEHGEELASYAANGTTIFDLGAGDTSKVAVFLKTLDVMKKRITYYALDISRESLVHEMKLLKGKKFDHVNCAGLWGTFDDLNQRINKSPLKSPGPRLFLSLGSVLFNDTRKRAIELLRMWAKHMRTQDLLLAGMDGHSLPDDGDKIWASYQDNSNHDLERFFENGLDRANKVIGRKYFKLEDWSRTSKLDSENEDHNGEKETKHEYIFEAKRKIEMPSLDVTFEKGAEFGWFDAHKNGEAEVRSMCYEVSLEVIKVWQRPGSKMTQYLIQSRQGIQTPSSGEE